MKLYWLLHPSNAVTFVTFKFFSFMFLLCHAFTTATLSEHRLVCFFSDSPLYYIIPHFDAQTHLGSKSIILIWGFVFP
jgi:hypothetical protein